MTESRCTIALPRGREEDLKNRFERRFMTEMTDAYQWKGRTMVGSDGEKIGKISEIYEDPHTGKPEWATVTAVCLAPSPTSSAGGRLARR